MKAKISLVVTGFVLLNLFSFGQMKIYNSELLKFGNVSEAPTLTKGFEVSMPNLFFHSGSTGVSINSEEVKLTVLDGGIGFKKEEGVGFVPRVTIPDPPIVANYTYGPVTRVQSTDRPLMLGSGTYQLVGVYSTRFYSSSATGISSLSDERYKTNIRPIEASLEKIKQINTVRFDYVQEDKLPEKVVDSTRSNRVGFIAQELQKILPEAVNYDPYERVYTVDYSVVIPFLVKAIQEQQAEIEELKRLISEK
ncbi:hypothetical protein HDR62_04975 [bacterium]|nr:hypothetical protein [bacterium]